MSERRGSWYLLTGLLIGAAIGLIYAWVISPVHYVNTSPASLRAEFKDRYRGLIAVAYAADGDLGRARVRLALLNDPDSVQNLAAQAQRDLAGGGDTAEARSLALLAAALGNQPVSVVSPTPTVDPVPTQVSPSPVTQTPVSPTASLTVTVTQTLTRTPTLTPGLTQINGTASLTPSQTLTPLISQTATTPVYSLTRITPSSTATATPTPGQPFVVIERSQVCDSTRLQPLLQVQLNDAAGHPVPGVEIVVSWQGGDDHFFTGLNPAINLGYADFVMSPNVTYTMQIADGGQPVTNITTPQCTDLGSQRYWGGWSIRMAQP